MYHPAALREILGVIAGCANVVPAPLKTSATVGSCPARHERGHRPRPASMGGMNGKTRRPHGALQTVAPAYPPGTILVSFAAIPLSTTNRLPRLPLSRWATDPHPADMSSPHRGGTINERATHRCLNFMAGMDRTNPVLLHSPVSTTILQSRERDFSFQGSIRLSCHDGVPLDGSAGQGWTSDQPRPRYELTFWSGIHNPAGGSSVCQKTSIGIPPRGNQ